MDAAVAGVRLGTPPFPSMARFERAVPWLLSFALVLYLGLNGGGYDAVVRSEVAVLVWWGVLLVAVAGLLPRMRPSVWLPVVALLGLSAWTALGIGGSESAERTVSELSRTLTYGGILVLAIALQGRSSLGATLGGVATAMGAITVLAILSRLHPSWFPENEIAVFLPGATHRLSYPLNYWNALAAFMAMAFPLLLAVAATARTITGRAVAASMLPLIPLGVSLCVSRGGVLVLVVGTAAFLLLAIDRLPIFFTTALGGAGGVLLAVAANRRDLIRDGLTGPAAEAQGTEVIWLCVMVCAGVGLLHAAVALALRHGQRPGWTLIGRRPATVASVAVVVAVMVSSVAAGLPGALSERWTEFKTPPQTAGWVQDREVVDRLGTSAGQGRWQLWASATDAFRASPVTGIGGGTFEYWWARNSTVPGHVRDAHSLYFQTLGELGLPGLAWLLVLVFSTLGIGLVRTVRASAEARTLLAGATAALVVFWSDASFEWIWQIAVLPAVALLLTGAVIAGGRSRQASPVSGGRRGARGAIAGTAAVALVVTAIPLAAEQEVRESRAAAAAEESSEAMRRSDTAGRIQPYAATPPLQKALILEEAGDLLGALEAVRRATRKEPTNWKLWATRARVEARLDREGAAIASFRRARDLNRESRVLGP